MMYDQQLANALAENSELCAEVAAPFQSHVNAAKSRTLRVTPKGRAYLAALALENDEFEEGRNG